MATSPRLSAMGFPTLRVSSRASSSACCLDLLGEAPQQPGPVTPERRRARRERRARPAPPRRRRRRRPGGPTSATVSSVAGFTTRTVPADDGAGVGGHLHRVQAGPGTDARRRLLRDATARRRRSAPPAARRPRPPVGRPRRHHEPATQPVDGLVVRATDGGRLAQDLRHHRAGLGRDLDVGETAPGRLMPVVAHDVGHVLEERPAQVDVEQLHPPADGQHRQVDRQGGTAAAPARWRHARDRRPTSRDAAPVRTGPGRCPRLPRARGRRAPRPRSWRRRPRRPRAPKARAAPDTRPPRRRCPRTKPEGRRPACPTGPTPPAGGTS